MFKNILLILSIVAILFPNSIYAADYAFAIGEKHWRVTLSQRSLNQLGYKTDRTDGVFSQSTANALESFQRKHNLPISKNIDKSTYHKLMELQKSSEHNAVSTTIKPAATSTTAVTSTINKPSPAVIATSKNPPASKNINKPSPNKNVPRQQSNAKALPDKVVTTASKYQGAPYRFGGTTPKGFDCSGYTQLVFKAHGISLPRTSDQQYKLGRPISKKELRKGDLVFFSTYEPGPSHVGIYDGNGKFWNATTSRGVMASPLNDPHYWGSRYLGARRIL